MNTILLAIAAAGAAASVVLLAMLLLRARDDGRGEAEKILRDELREGRVEAAESAKALRGEVAGQMKGAIDTLTHQLGELGKAQDTRLDSVRGTLDQKLKDLQSSNEKKLDEMRTTVDEKLDSPVR